MGRLINAKLIIFALFLAVLVACADTADEKLKITVANRPTLILSLEEKASVRAAPGKLLGNPSDLVVDAINDGAGEIHLTDLGPDQEPQSLLAVYQYPRQRMADGRRVQPAVICAGKFEPITIVECTESLQIGMSVPEYGDISVNHESVTSAFAMEMLIFISDSDLTTDQGEKLSNLTVNNIQYNDVDDLFHVFGWTGSGADFSVTVQHEELIDDPRFAIVDWSCN